MSETVEAVKAPHKNLIVLPMPTFNSDDGLREHAYYTTEMSQLTKLSAKYADVLDDAVVVLLTETKIRGRSGVYAEYIFALPDGERRRLSAKDKMTVRVKQLMEEYECWHLEAVGAFSYDWIQQQDDYPGSDADEEAAVRESKGYKEDELREELDEESESEDMEDMQTCRYFAEKEVEQCGLSEFSKVRHIDTWDDSVLRAYAKTGEMSLLPTVHSSISDLSGKPLLVYATVVDSKERLTMRDDKRMASWFAVGAKVIGEGRSSTEMRPVVLVMTAIGVDLSLVQSIEFAVQDLHSTLESAVIQMRKENSSGMEVKPVGLFVASQSVVVKWCFLQNMAKHG